MTKEELEEKKKAEELRDKEDKDSKDSDEVKDASDDSDDDKEKDDDSVDEKKKKYKKEMTKEDTDKINDMFGDDETLSEDFKNKASTLFESLVAEKVAAIDEEKQVKLDEEIAKLEEKTESYINDVVLPKVDEYVTYVAEEWLKENELAVEKGIRSEVSESFMSALRGVFEEHYIDIPEDKVDVVEEQRKEIVNLKSSLNEKTEEIISIRKDLSESSKDDMIEEATKDLSKIEADRVRKLAEGIYFDEDTFGDKLSVIIESIGSEKPKGSESPENMLNESAGEEEVNPQMKRYLDALKKFNQ